MTKGIFSEQLNVSQNTSEVVHKTQEGAQLRPICVESSHRCNIIHEEEKDADRRWPHFTKKVTKYAVHNAPQAAIVSNCSPPASRFIHSFIATRPIVSIFAGLHAMPAWII